jgi:hypothetical protein
MMHFDKTGAEIRLPQELRVAKPSVKMGDGRHERTLDRSARCARLLGMAPADELLDVVPGSVAPTSLATAPARWRGGLPAPRHRPDGGAPASRKALRPGSPLVRAHGLVDSVP